MIVAAAVLGLIIGSFLNVCIYRMPLGESIAIPRSHCVICNHVISWHDNIPLFSFIVLMGRCRFCGGRISLRYPIVEALTAAIFALLVGLLGVNAITIVYMVLSCALIVATFIDIQYQIIPDEITYTGMVLGLVLSLALPRLHSAAGRLDALLSSLSGIALGGFLIYVVAVLGTIFFKKKLMAIGEETAMGGGDIKFLAMIGAFLGWRGVIIVFFLAPFFGSVVGVIEKLRRKADIIPYGPYLSLTAFIVILWGEKIGRFLFPCNF
ncbi:MAG: prepilin peptidase [Candidatus Omnitrophota bacterium]|jgi:leader peptidase (prepilin peptidase)/N-methyltransferase